MMAPGVVVDERLATASNAMGFSKNDSDVSQPLGSSPSNGSLTATFGGSGRLSRLKYTLKMLYRIRAPELHKASNEPKDNP